MYNLISVHNKGLTIPHYSVLFTYWWQFGKWWIEIFDVVSPVTTLPQLLFNFMKNKIFLRFIFIRLSFFSLCSNNFPPKTWNKIHTFTGVLLQSTVQLIFLWNILPEFTFIFLVSSCFNKSSFLPLRAFKDLLFFVFFTLFFGELLIFIKLSNWSLHITKTLTFFTVTVTKTNKMKS